MTEKKEVILSDGEGEDSKDSHHYHHPIPTQTRGKENMMNSEWKTESGGFGRRKPMGLLIDRVRIGIETEKRERKREKGQRAL